MKVVFSLDGLAAACRLITWIQSCWGHLTVSQQGPGPGWWLRAGEEDGFERGLKAVIGEPPDSLKVGERRGRGAIAASEVPTPDLKE